MVFLNQSHALDLCNARAKHERIENTCFVLRRVRMALVNSRNFKRAQALRYRNLRPQMSVPIEVEALNPEAFRDLICAATP
jgi:hypothetical protein